MARKKDRSSDKKSSRRRLRLFSNLKDETLHGVIAVSAFAGSIIILLSRFGKAGWAGDYIYSSLSWFLGVGYYIVPVVFIILGILYLKNLHREFDSLKLVGSGLFIISVLGIISVISPLEGGTLGAWAAWPTLKLFGQGASLVVLAAIVVISVLVAFNTELDAVHLLFWRKSENKGTKEDDKKEYKEVDIKLPPETKIKEKLDKEGKEKVPLFAAMAEKDEDLIGKRSPRLYGKTYEPPPLSLLEEDRGKPGVGDIKANANIIKRTLANFGIDVEMDEVSIGPSVTRYALKPAEGVKLARIVALQDDLSLALAAHPLRIEAPIPGKSLVGIEVPNTTKTTVGLGTLLANEEFRNSEKSLLVSLGKGISGKSHFASLGKMPHLLIAGATGSGKSVTIHTLITSLLYRNSPDDMKFIMIDPKRVELTLYNKIPHLLTPVITDAKKAIIALKWAAKEMDRRYDVLQEAGARDIESYHGKISSKIQALSSKKEKDGVEEEMPDTMPYIIVIIDELADIMATYPRELEAGIVRLAQMSRAVGIHLMLSTQRPSVNVITGLIKANIPARIALQVASQVDSRTILDMMGAEKLLGAGDMLYMSGEMSKPVRIQSAFISEGEVKNVVKYLKDSYRDELQDEISLTDAGVADKNAIFSASLDEDEVGEDDDLYNEAKAVVIEAGKASTSYIQRKLRVGYARAARLMDLLEERGMIGPADGSKPRSIIGVVSSDKEVSSPQEKDGEASS